jgi:hypothetical protein
MVTGGSPIVIEEEALVHVCCGWPVCVEADGTAHSRRPVQTSIAIFNTSTSAPPIDRLSGSLA